MIFAILLYFPPTKKAPQAQNKPRRRGQHYFCIIFEVVYVSDCCSIFNDLRNSLLGHVPLLILDELDLHSIWVFNEKELYGGIRGNNRAHLQAFFDKLVSIVRRILYHEAYGEIVHICGMFWIRNNLNIRCTFRIRKKRDSISDNTLDLQPAKLLKKATDSSFFALCIVM